MIVKIVIIFLLGSLYIPIIPHGPGKFMCVPCNKEYSYEKSLLLHIRTIHEGRQFACPICGKIFNQKGNLKTHIRGIHEKKKSFVCETCPKVFSRREVLENHMLIHTQEKPFKCSDCPESFRQKSTLNQHRGRIHKKIRRFVCTTDKCNKSFYRKVDLLHHAWNHTDKRPFSCQYCSKGYIYKRSQVSHEKNCAYKADFSKRPKSS